MSGRTTSVADIIVPVANLETKCLVSRLDDLNCSDIVSKADAIQEYRIASVCNILYAGIFNVLLKLCRAPAELPESRASRYSLGTLLYAGRLGAMACSTQGAARWLALIDSVGRDYQ